MFALGKTFSARKHKTRHEKIHLDVPPIACPVPGCDWRTTRGDKVLQVLTSYTHTTWIDWRIFKIQSMHFIQIFICQRTTEETYGKVSIKGLLPNRGTPTFFWTPRGINCSYGISHKCLRSMRHPLMSTAPYAPGPLIEILGYCQMPKSKDTLDFPYQPFLSPPVLTYGALLGVTFCLSVHSPVCHRTKIY